MFLNEAESVPIVAEYAWGRMLVSIFEEKNRKKAV